MVQSHRIPKIPVKPVEVFAEDLKAKLTNCDLLDRDVVYKTDTYKIGKEFLIGSDSDRPDEHLDLVLRSIRREFGLEVEEQE